MIDVSLIDFYLILLFPVWRGIIFAFEHSEERGWEWTIQGLEKGCCVFFGNIIHLHTFTIERENGAENL